MEVRLTSAAGPQDGTVSPEDWWQHTEQCPSGPPGQHSRQLKRLRKAGGDDGSTVPPAEAAAAEAGGNRPPALVSDCPLFATLDLKAQVRCTDRERPIASYVCYLHCPRRTICNFINSLQFSLVWLLPRDRRYQNLHVLVRHVTCTFLVSAQSCAWASGMSMNSLDASSHCFAGEVFAAGGGEE